MRGKAASQRAAPAASQQPRAPTEPTPAELGNCGEAAAPSGSRRDAAVQTEAAEPVAADAQASWARLAAAVAQDPRVVNSLQASFIELAASRASGGAGGAQALTEGQRHAADSAAFTAALAAALAAGVAAAGDSFGVAPATADATRWGRLRRGPAVEHSDSEAAGGAGAARRPSKPRLRWTPELSAAFEAAVASLGGLQSAAPQQILTRMRDAGEGPPELNLAHLKSHLQKCRLADGRRRAAAAAAAVAAGGAVPEAGAGGGVEGIALLLRLAAASHEPQAAAAPALAMPASRSARRR